MKLQDLVLHNFRLKLVSLLIAVLVWVALHLATQPESSGFLSLFLTSTNQTFH
jgi:hypothetical protein